MKRLLIIAALLAAPFATAGSASAATTSYGSARLQWTTAPAATMTIVSQYNAAGAQGNGTPQLLPSAAGICAGSGSETNFTLSFGTMTPQALVASGCLYKNALAVSIQTNDASGYAISQYLDSAPGSGVGICAYPNGGASFPLTPAIAPLATSARSGNPAAGTFTGSNLTGCGPGGSVVPAGAGGASTAGSTPGNPGTPGLEYYAPSTASLALMTSTNSTSNGSTLQTMYGAEDVQLVLGPGAVTTGALQNLYVTIQLVLN
ncbi:MAG: hypothetical protein NVS3B7_17610 [Candidatus Elarobacter sp.]